MVKFVLKSFFVMTVLLFGVLFGMQKASDGMQAMRGEDSLPDVFRWSNDSGDLEVMGDELTSHDLKEKQEKLAEIGAFNVFSAIGHAIATGLKNMFKQILSFLSSLFQQLIG